MKLFLSSSLALVLTNCWIHFVHSMPVGDNSELQVASTSSSSAFPSISTSKGTDKTASSSSSSTIMHPLRLEDIPIEGIDVAFKVNNVAQRSRKGLGEMRDPSRFSKYREQFPNESSGLYRRRQAAFFSKYKGLEKVKESIYNQYPSNQERAEMNWQAYLRQRADENRLKNFMLRIRSRMKEANLIHPDTIQHVTIQEKSNGLFRITPKLRKQHYDQRKRRSDRYRVRIQDPLFQPSNQNALKRRAGKVEIMAPISVQDDAGRDPVLGFRIARKSRTVRQPFVDGTL